MALWCCDLLLMTVKCYDKNDGELYNLYPLYDLQYQLVRLANSSISFILSAASQILLKLNYYLLINLCYLKGLKLWKNMYKCKCIRDVKLQKSVQGV